MERTLEFVVPAVSCGHCVKTVTSIARRLDPNAQVQAELTTQRVQIHTSAPREALIQALAEEGYPPSV